MCQAPARSIEDLTTAVIRTSCLCNFGSRHGYLRFSKLALSTTIGKVFALMYGGLYCSPTNRED